jgi:hypothetical protein
MPFKIFRLDSVKYERRRHFYRYVHATYVRSTHMYEVRKLTLDPRSWILIPKGTHKRLLQALFKAKKDLHQYLSEHRDQASSQASNATQLKSAQQSQLTRLHRHSNSGTCTPLSYFLRLFWAVRLFGIASSACSAAFRYVTVCYYSNIHTKASSTRRLLL